MAGSLGFDLSGWIQKLISGESLVSLISLETLPEKIRESVVQSLAPLVLNMAVPIGACALLRTVLGKTYAAVTLNLVCVLCCATSLTQAWFTAQRQAISLIDTLLNVTNQMSPVMASAAALTGGTLWSASVAPLSNLCASLMQQALRDWGIRLCTVAGMVAISCAIAGRYALNRLFELTKSILRWMLGAIMLINGGLISAQGLTASAGDGAVLKTTKIALERLIPIVGGGVSDAAGSLLVSAGFARSAIGITGVALILRLCAQPVLKIGGMALALKLIAAATEPLTEGEVSALIGRFGDIVELLLAIAICSFAMAAMMPASFAALAGGVFQ